MRSGSNTDPVAVGNRAAEAWAQADPGAVMIAAASADGQAALMGAANAFTEKGPPVRPRCGRSIVAASSRFETLNALSNTAPIMACRGLHSSKQASQNPYEGCVSSSAWTAGRTRSPAGRTTYACTARNLSRSSPAPSPMPPVHRRSGRAGSRGSLRTPTDARPGIHLRTRRSTCGSAMVAPPPARQPVGRRSRTRCP